MASPEQPSQSEHQQLYLRHPRWTIPVDLPRRISLRKDTRGRNKMINEQTRESLELRALISTKYHGLAEAIGVAPEVLSGPEVCEVAFRTAAEECITEKLQELPSTEQGELNVLVVNYGSPHVDTTLPVKIAENNKDSKHKMHMRFLLDPEQPRANNEEFTVGNCTFSTITESELSERNSVTDVVLMYGNSNYGYDASQAPQFREMSLAELLLNNLNQNDNIFISSDESLDRLRKLLAQGGIRRDYHGTFGTVFLDVDEKTLSLPLRYKTNERVVWAISKNYATDEEEALPFVYQNRGWSSWSRTRKLTTVGVPLAAAGIAAGAIFATLSSEHSNQSATQKPVSCASGEIPVYPGAVEPNTPKPHQFTFVFHPPNEPELDVVDRNNQLIVSQAPLIYSPIPADVGITIGVRTGILHVGPQTLLFCEAPPKPASSSTGSQSKTGT